MGMCWLGERDSCFISQTNLTLVTDVAKKYFLVCNHTLFVILYCLLFLPLKISVKPCDAETVV